MTTEPETLNDYIDIAKRRKWSFMTIFGIFVVGFTVVAMFLPPVYKSAATILIEEQEIPQNFVMATVTSFVEQRLQSINQRIMSTSRLLEVINTFDLYTNLRDRWTTEEIVEKMREDVKLEPISADVVDRRTGRPTMATIAFTLSYEGRDTPRKIQQVADRLTSLFLEENLQIRERQTEEISKFLQEEINRQKQEVEEVEKKIVAYKEAHINELPEMLQVNIQGLNNTQRSLERLEDQLSTLGEREGYLETQLSSTEPENKTADPDKRRLEELKLQMVNLKSRFSDDHPDVKKLKTEISELEKQIYPTGKPASFGQDLPDNPAYITLASQLSSVKAEIAFVREQMKNLEEEEKVYLKRIENSPRVEQEYNTLLIERNTSAAKYDDLMRKIMEARVAQNLEKENKGERFTIIDPARLPEKPFKPNRLAIILIGVVLGIGAGIGVSFVRELSDDSVRNAEDLASATSFPVLANIRVIMTDKEMRLIRKKRYVKVIASMIILVGAIVIFHYFIMDLDIFWAKVMRRLAI